MHIKTFNKKKEKKRNLTDLGYLFVFIHICWDLLSLQVYSAIIYYSINFSFLSCAFGNKLIMYINSDKIIILVTTNI